MGEFLSFVTIDVWTLIFTWVNLLILFLLMKKFLFKPIRGVIEKREQEIAASIEEAEKAKNDALNMKEEYEKKLENAYNNAEEIVKNATRNAMLKEEEILKEANKKASDIMERAVKQIEQQKKAAISDIRNEISGMATSIASKIIERDINEQDHKKLIDEFIENA